MRVRLYEVGHSVVGEVLRFDQFPVRFALDDQCGLTYDADPDQQLFCLEEIDGQLVFEAHHVQEQPLVNNAPLERGPLMPGDRLAIRDREFIVSYERTSVADSFPARYHIQQHV